MGADMTSTTAMPTTGVIITGGGSGIGRATARALADVGRPVAVWDRDADAAHATAAEVANATDVATVGIGIDVRDTARFADAIATSRAVLGTVGGFVHGAGIPGAGAIDELDEAVWDDVIAIHLTAAALLIRDLTPDLLSNAGSAIVLISSIEAVHGHEAIPAYCAAKTGMLGLVRSTAARLGPRGVRANAVCPGFIDTPMLAPSLATPGTRERYDARIPLGRLGRPADIAHAVRFLLSDDAAYLTAQELVVDGGVTRTTM
jgi:NAD(P)-dependent dehydrogenase (short-subunit alcohol dehydrogenase family)